MRALVLNGKLLQDGEVVHHAVLGLSRANLRGGTRAFFAKRLLRRLVELLDDVVLERVETDAGGEQNLSANAGGQTWAPRNTRMRKTMCVR